MSDESKDQGANTEEDARTTGASAEAEHKDEVVVCREAPRLPAEGLSEKTAAISTNIIVPLAKFAAENTGKQELSQLLTGPTALAFGQEGIVQLAKALIDYIRVSKTTLSIKGGLIDSQLINTEAVRSLATLPPIEVLRAKLLGLLLSPIFSLQNVLSANLRGLNSVLNARIQQLGGTTDV